MVPPPLSWLISRADPSLWDGDLEFGERKKAWKTLDLPDMEDVFHIRVVRKETTPAPAAVPHRQRGFNVGGT
jgi:hypothetical protein